MSFSMIEFRNLITVLIGKWLRYSDQEYQRGLDVQ